MFTKQNLIGVFGFLLISAPTHAGSLHFVIAPDRIDHRTVKQSRAVDFSQASFVTGKLVSRPSQIELNFKKAPGVEQCIKLATEAVRSNGVNQGCHWETVRPSYISIRANQADIEAKGGGVKATLSETSKVTCEALNPRDLYMGNRSLFYYIGLNDFGAEKLQCVPTALPGTCMIKVVDAYFDQGGGKNFVVEGVHFVFENDVGAQCLEALRTNQKSGWGTRVKLSKKVMHWAIDVARSEVSLIPVIFALGAEKVCEVQ